MPEHYEEKTENNRIGDDELKKEAANLVYNEYNTYKDLYVPIQEDMALDVRSLIRNCRRNYFGVYVKPKDKVTGVDKIFIPLTEAAVESVVKNIDLDTKDINFKANKPFAFLGVSIIRSLVRQFLNKINFGTLLDKLAKDGAIDGGAIWKSSRLKQKGKKTELRVNKVDLLNTYFDPTVESLSQLSRFTERVLMTKSQVDKMKDWYNKDDIVFDTNLHRTDTDLRGYSTDNTTKFADIFETWGYIPKHLKTGLEEDRNEEIWGRIVVSGIESGNAITQYIEEVEEGYMPYEDFIYNPVSNRWLGRGVAEKLISLQRWINAIKNASISHSLIASLGLWKIRQGSGIQPDAISRMAQNYGILVEQMDDIQPLPIPNTPATNYNDENVIVNWSQRTTGTFEAATGEQLPSQSTATEAAIQSRSSQSLFVLIKEQMGMFLERWLMEHAIPVMIENLDEAEIVRIIGDTDELREFEEQIVKDTVGQWIIAKTEETGFSPAEDLIEKAEMGVRGEMKALGKDFFVKIKKALINLKDYQLDINITNEKEDISVLTQRLSQMLSVAPEYRKQIMRNIFDIFGMDFKEEDIQEVPQGQTGGRLPAITNLSPEQQLQEAVTQ